jgi:hypothetical protein
MYSLVNVATLVRDLARHPLAEAVATELLRAFALCADDLTALDGVVYDARDAAARRTQLLTDDGARPRALQVLAAARGFADDLGLDAYTAAADVLESTPIGDLAGLRRFVRDEVLVWCWQSSGDVAVARRPHALDVVTDGVLGAYAGDEQLSRPWRELVAAGGIDPAPTAWPNVVSAVRGLDRDGAIPPAPAEWAARMHEACWAVHLTGRERVAAVTQLHALVALVRVWSPEQPPLRAVAMTSAAVHAEVVGDVLDTATRDAMSRPLFMSQRLFRSSSGRVP